jgi:hypothetical protein
LRGPVRKACNVPFAGALLRHRKRHVPPRAHNCAYVEPEASVSSPSALTHARRRHRAVPRSPDGSRKRFFLPVRVLSRMFRDKILALPGAAFRKRNLRFPAPLKLLSSPTEFDRFIRRLPRIEWVVYTPAVSIYLSLASVPLLRAPEKYGTARLNTAEHPFLRVLPTVIMIQSSIKSVGGFLHSASSGIPPRSTLHRAQPSPTAALPIQD